MKGNREKNEGGGAPGREMDIPDWSALPAGLWSVFAAWVLYVLIVLPAWNAPFIFDDGPGIVENAAIVGDSLPKVLFTSPSDVTPYGRPVVSISLAFNHALAGFSPWFFRFFNLSLHGLNSLLVYLLLRRLMATAGRYQSSTIEPVALAVSLLWMFHPLGTNISLYIVQRAEGFVIFFLLLALYCACRALQPGVRLKSDMVQAKVWAWLTVCFCALGMLSKESMVIAPVAIYLLDAALFSRSLMEPLRRRWKWYAWLAATWVLLAVVMFLWPRKYSVGTESGLGALQYFVVQMEVLTSYLFKALWPGELHLDYWIFEPTGWWPVVLGFCLLSILFALAVWGSWRGQPLGYLALVAFLVLAPTSTFVPVRSMPGAEYRFYFPLLAVIYLLVIVLWLLSHRVSLRHGRAIFLSLIFVWGIGLATRTSLRAGEFSTPETIWQQVKDKFPNNVRALNALGSFALDAGRIDQARSLFRNSIEILPEHGDAYANLGMLEGQNGNLELARDYLKKSVELWPFNPSTWSNLGITYDGLGEKQLSEQAFLKSLELGPHLAEPNFNLGVLYLRQERWDEGRAQIRRTLQIDPKHQGANSIRQQLLNAGMWSDF